MSARQDSAILGTPWQVGEKAQMQSGQKTIKNGRYMTQSNITYAGRLFYTMPPTSDPYAQWWYDQVRAQIVPILQSIKDQFIQRMNNGVTVNSIELDYTITFDEPFIPVGGVRNFTLFGNKYVQFTDISDPFGVDDIIIILLALYVIAFIVTILAIIIYYILKFLGIGPGFLIGLGVLIVAGLVAYGLFFTSKGRKGLKKGYHAARKYAPRAYRAARRRIK